MSVAFLIIDAQYDFCHPEGALFVPGAETDVQRINNVIKMAGRHIDQLFFTLDTHQVLDISHPGFWNNAQGLSPAPFTIITSEMVKQQEWMPRFFPEQVELYLETLSSHGEFDHIIWPEHCLAGSKGAMLDETLFEVARNWSLETYRNYTTIVKGTNPLTEHFGVFQAQVPLHDAPETQFNMRLLQQLQAFDTLLIAGEARSHCVATSLKQLLGQCSHIAERVIVLEDAMSDVTGLGHLATPIYTDAREKGVRFMSCQKAIDLLLES
jgi:nicotinamidase-related amidase